MGESVTLMQSRPSGSHVVMRGGRLSRDADDDAPNFVGNAERARHRVRRLRDGRRFVDLGKLVGKQLAIFACLDRGNRCAENLDVVLVEYAAFLSRQNGNERFPRSRRGAWTPAKWYPPKGEIMR